LRFRQPNVRLAIQINTASRAHVMVDIEKMLKALGIDSPEFSVGYTDQAIPAPGGGQE
jgi:hypothetical protein